MPHYEPGDIDEDGDEVQVCPECEGSGKDSEYDPEEWGEGDERHPLAPIGDCPVCCGFGRLDW